MVDEGAKAPAAERTPVKRNDEADVDENMENDDTSKVCEPEPLAVQGTKDEGNICGTCGQKTTDYTCNQGNYVRCNNCNTLKRRMQRVFSKNEDLREEWNDLGQEARGKWLQDAAVRLAVPDLHKAMTLYIEKSRKTTNKVTSGLQKWYGDSPDLRDRYKGKEEQLQHVKARAPKVWHEHRRMWLY